ncbi:MAG TPA: hypothetical protein VFB96_11580 [Pirellulaceae bacterium]|nr:hypothetical protein [Pirellulaceae bacterium]
MHRARFQFGLASLLWFTVGVGAIINLLLAAGSLAVLISWLCLAVYYLGARDFVAERFHWLAALTGLVTVGVFAAVFVGWPLGREQSREQEIVLGLALGAVLGSCLMSYGVHLLDRVLAVVDHEV